MAVARMFHRRWSARRRKILITLSDFADHRFNADDRAAELNGGSYEVFQYLCAPW
jgi:hypothetical protein